MPELRPKNPELAAFVEGKKYTLEPAIKRYVGEFEVYPYEYTTDLEATGFESAAVKLTFEDGTIVFLDSDEVIV